MPKKMTFVFALILTAISTPLAVFSQGNTDIYLILMKMDEGKSIFSDPVKINPTEGYNNQPSFHPDGNSLFYSSGAGTNTDIYRYDINTGKTERLTDTLDSEYSPILMPGGDKFSVIQLVNSEGPRKGAQPLIAFPLSGGNSEMIFEEGEKVGYHAWIDRQRVALFLLGTPHFLQIVDLKDLSSIRVADNIGRSLYKIPGQEAISFSQSREDGQDVIMMYSLESGKTQPIVPMLEGNGFYAWTSLGSLMMGVGAELFEFNPGENKDWRKIGDLSDFGIQNISRIATDSQGRWLAVVNSR